MNTNCTSLECPCSDCNNRVETRAEENRQNYQWSEKRLMSFDDAAAGTMVNLLALLEGKYLLERMEHWGVIAGFVLAHVEWWEKRAQESVKEASK